MAKRKINGHTNVAAFERPSSTLSAQERAQRAYEDQRESVLASYRDRLDMAMGVLADLVDRHNALDATVREFMYRQQYTMEHVKLQCRRSPLDTAPPQVLSLYDMYMIEREGFIAKIEAQRLQLQEEIARAESEARSQGESETGEAGGSSDPSGAGAKGNSRDTPH